MNRPLCKTDLHSVCRYLDEYMATLKDAVPASPRKANKIRLIKKLIHKINPLYNNGTMV